MNFIHGYKESASHHRENGNDFCRAQYFAAIDNVTETIRPQFVDTLFIVRLRLNMSMRCAVIINYGLFFNTKGGVENKLLSSTQVLLRSNEVSLA